jgi:DNA repair exonuclease SbcCD ATPase subunit
LATVDEMTRMVCGECGCEHWLVTTFIQDKRESGRGWYCPNGHKRVYLETEAQKLAKKVAQLERDLSDKSAKITKLKEGRCPFCWRTVKNLSSHIANKH